MKKCQLQLNMHMALFAFVNQSPNEIFFASCVSCLGVMRICQKVFKYVI
jgi:hypothetical protein